MMFFRNDKKQKMLETVKKTLFKCLNHKEHESAFVLPDRQEVCRFFTIKHMFQDSVGSVWRIQLIQAIITVKNGFKSDT